MEEMPEEIFYDAACMEYPEQGTRMHSGMIYSTALDINVELTGRVLGLDGINSEICEQVNGYLQC